MTLLRELLLGVLLALRRRGADHAVEALWLIGGHPSWRAGHTGGGFQVLNADSIFTKGPSDVINGIRETLVLTWTRCRVRCGAG